MDNRKTNPIFNTHPLFSPSEIDDFLLDFEIVIENIEASYDPDLKSNFFGMAERGGITPTRYHPSSKLARLITLRFLLTDSATIIINRARARAYEMGLKGKGEIYLCPVSSIRRYVVGSYTSDCHAAAMLETEPHYDNGFGCFGLSVWLPFHAISRDDGALIRIIEKNLLKAYGSPGSKNKYHFDSYLLDHKNVDRHLQTGGFESQNVEKGSVVAHQDVLHAALKNFTPRSSFNFRFVSESELIGRPDNIKDLYYKFNSSPQRFIKTAIERVENCSICGIETPNIFDLNKILSDYRAEFFGEESSIAA